MKNYPHILSYLALSLLAACGGGGGGGSPSTASSDTNQPKIECNAECQAGREAERKAAEEAEKAKAAEEAQKAKVEAERKATEEAEKAKAEAERKAAEEAEKARVETERKAAEEAEKAKAEAERKATEEAQKAKVEAERKSAEEAEKAKAEAERKAAEEAEKARVETERKAAEEAEKAKAQAERKAAEEAEKARVEAERKAAEEAEEAEKAKAEAERKAAEEAEKTKVEAERKAAEKAKAEAEKTKAAEAAAATQQIDGYYSKISQSGMEGDDISHIGDINILELDGQKIPLLPETEPQRAEVFGNVNEKSVLVAATHLKYGRYGFYGLKNGDTDIHTSYMFYQGVITPEAAMPQEGQAFYRGYALYSDVGQANTFGNSIFMVDFGRKSLSGAVYSENGEFDEVNLEGQIVGNRFFHVDEKEQKIMSGMFLGPQAEELTGRFDHLLESKNGTFGAAALKE